MYALLTPGIRRAAHGSESVVHLSPDSEAVFFSLRFSQTVYLLWMTDSLLKRLTEQPNKINKIHTKQRIKNIRRVF